MMFQLYWKWFFIIHPYELPHDGMVLDELMGFLKSGMEPMGPPWPPWPPETPWCDARRGVAWPAAGESREVQRLSDTHPQRASGTQGSQWTQCGHGPW